MIRQPVSLIVPAYNEEQWIASTLKAIEENKDFQEIIVVDDGSRDKTAEIAGLYADRVIRHSTNLGKAAAIFSGAEQASHSILCCLDADLGQSARQATRLLEPIWREECDITVAILPQTAKKGGFGLVKWTAHQGIQHLTGRALKAPLSGQRALRRKILDDIHWIPVRFGWEVGLSIQLLRAGYRLQEVAIPFSHRESGRNWQGFLHRGKECKDVLLALMRAYREQLR